MTTLIAIALAAGLFALFGWIDPRGCDGRCAGCAGACGRSEEKENRHVH